ncbi:MAG: M20/M25/M40 family metallo-hydrolase [Ilumatobacter fluminis]|uniref:Acetylornithine deacetylase/succinyl-diaminopimelate desuccinylase-like protein n=1 Tax=Ilumatobacter fluminis TaxID=467091 RepID=A0A4R7I3Q6_9ACTN|nr:M20/M25/M40 family metallo-hydrolase [Ilumatobacter fluminis]TDT17579.1 acetylornithine deacetylase/succinyl-diaminopimelate desuccinylase-like protein [Ilumatobacter fluminis]
MTERALTAETVELLQTMIQNACVNDGTRESGEETRNADTLQHFMEGAGLDVQRFEAVEGRASIVARIEGSDPDAPSLCLMGHTDVVPVSPDGWSRDPFGGELVRNDDGVEEVWGRGAIDMLNLTSSMAVAFRDLARSGFRPKGDLIYFGVADEEAGGTWGAEWMFEHHPEAIDADYCLTELGGWSTVDDHGHRHVTVNVGEKGLAWRRLRVSGTPGHGSMPFGADNALVKAAEVVRRLSEYRPNPRLGPTWTGFVDSLSIPAELKSAMLDPERVYDAISTLPVPQARMCHALTHTTISPNVAEGGQKTNVIPDTVDIEVDIRTVPGTSYDDVKAMLDDALGDLAPHVDVTDLQVGVATESPTDNDLWDTISKRTQIVYPDATLVPGLVVGGTDARFYRQRGRVAYGAGLFSPSMDFATFGNRFHGHDERIDVESLALATEFWIGISKDLVG